MTTLRDVLLELRGRSVWQVLGVYLLGSWVAYEVVLGLVQGLGLPDWVPPAAIVLILLGIPVVLATALIQRSLAGAPEGAAAAPAAAPAPPSPPPRPAHRIFTWRRATVAGVLAFAALGLAVTGFMGMRTLGIGPVGSLVGKGELEASDHILVADFDPLTGDSAIAAVVAEALRVDLTQSALLNLVDRTRVREALERMTAEGDVALTADVAREVAFRLGLKAVVEGEVGVAGGSYMLSASLVTPDSGRVLASFRETARDSTDLLPAVDRLSRQLREKAGESLRTIRANPPLTQVTTASLPALRKYVAGREAERSGNRDVAIDLMRQALALDPEFASAHRAMAVFLWNDGDRGDTLFHHIEEAVRLGDRLTEYERHHARGFAATVRFDLEAARRAYETLLAMDSADNVAINNLGVVYSLVRDSEGAYAMARRAFDLGSRGVTTTYWNLVQGQLNLGLYDDIEPTVRLALADHPDSPFPYVLRWLGAMARDDDALVDSAVASLEDRPEWRGFGARLDVFRALLHGRLGPGRTLAEAVADDPVEALHTAVPEGYVELFIRQRPDDAADRVEAAVTAPAIQDLPMADRPYPQLALILALAGRTDAARDLVRQFREGVRPELLRQHEAMLGGAEGIADVMDGRVEAGLGRLRAARRVAPCLACAEGLAGVAFEAAALPDSAIAAYERYLATPWADRHLFLEAAPPNDPFVRAFIHERLGALYEETGDAEAARRHLTAFLDLWRDADPELQPRVDAARRSLRRLGEIPG